MATAGISWVRGGNWTIAGIYAVPPEPPRSLGSVMRAVRSGAPSAAGRKGGPQKVQKPPRAWPPKSVDTWNDEWGNLIGVQAYVVSAANAKAALDWASQFSAGYSRLREDETFTGEGPGETQAFQPWVNGPLLNFLADYGPLGFVKTLGNRIPHRKGKTRIHLLDMAEELTQLGNAWTRVSKRLGSPNDEDRRADELVRESKYALTDSYLEPLLDQNDTVRITARAASLRAWLWVTVLDRTQALRGICRQCPAPLEPQTGRGRPYEYCPEHRTAAAQKRRQRSNFAGISM